MKKRRANEIMAKIAKLAEEIEHDAELLAIDERYSIAASWIDTDISNVSLE